MTTTWTTIGQEYSTGDAARACIEREITRLEWHAAKPKLAMPMMQGMAINHAARQTNGRLVRVAWNGALGSMGFYALEKRYTNGEVAAHTPKGYALYQRDNGPAEFNGWYQVDTTTNPDVLEMLAGWLKEQIADKRAKAHA